MLRWLTRLFRQRVEAESDPAAALPPPPAPPPPPTVPVAVETTAVAEPAVEQPAMDISGATPPVEATSPSDEEGLEVSATNDAVEATTLSDDEVKETCPTCGRTSVFAGPPGQRFCTYCALRDELFERRAAASE